MRTERILASGLAFPEGPSLGPDGSIFVVELAGRRVTRVVPDGHVETFATIEGSPNGSAFGSDGALYICNNGGLWAAETSTGDKWGPGGYTASIQRIWPNGTIETVIDSIDDQPLNSPNDICFGPDNGIWFTDPRWPDERGICPPGDLGYIAASGAATRIATDLQMPNGLGVTPNGDTLLVTASRTYTIHAFPIVASGQLGPERLFAQLDDGVFPDGICFDQSGRVFCAGHGGSLIYVLSPTGQIEERIPMDDKDISNLCFGGPTNTTLYVTESDAGRLAAIEWHTPGMVPFPMRKSGDR
ncbi:MAG: SMP-30/gluconolactonase/LRE family protein [Acidimicrobiales bacterium]